MANLPRISETEWEIMRVVWEKNPITAADIIDLLLKEDPTWHPVTAKTLLNRLVKKGALGYDLDGRAYVYRPLVRERDCVNAVSSSFLDRVFDGSLQTMVAHFVEHRKLSPKQVKELRKVLDEQ
ncbi:MAG TPA: BlaI/MecI/CopY family transcriptional regulator [Candidatus Limnocylindria bacterium]|jgi:BlaI family penicillinase repressor|nr:BlaI/MecI/CopY family transcriptional regulator [Candidatus Limnocylindria bacterium]